MTCTSAASRLGSNALVIHGEAIVPACASTETFQRPLARTANGSNEANRAVMVESAADLAHGRALESSEGRAAAAAVERLRSDHRKQLDAPPTSGLAAGGAAGTSADPN